MAARDPNDSDSGSDLESFANLKISDPKKTEPKVLDRRYGFFRCTHCKTNWQSSLTFLKSNKDGELTWFKQQCKRCKRSFEPYKTERIRCATCGEEDCVCSDDDKLARRMDKRKPHLADLCEKCKAGIPCRGADYWDDYSD